MTIGSELRQAREQRGIALEEIAARTKIRLPILRAIEQDEFRTLPVGVTTRGLLKQYAREVGIDPEAIGRRYQDLFEPIVGTPPPPAVDPPMTLASVERRPVGRLVAAVVLVGLAAGGGYLVMTRARTSPGGAASTAAVTTPAPVDASRAPRAGDPIGITAAATQTESGATGSSGRTGESLPVPAGVVRVTIEARGDCWIAATADGRQVAYRVVKTDERLSIDVKNEAILRIGNPANVVVTINGAPTKSLAPPGMPATLRITPDTYRELLAAEGQGDARRE